MALKPGFNNWAMGSEQKLMADLIIESIQQYGFDMLYLPRTMGNRDDMYNQDDMPEFNSVYTIEMYIKSVDSFEGEGSFLSKFGLEVRDRVSLSVARRRFDEEIGVPATLPRPREGDLIYFTMTKKLFEIIYVDNRAIFYPLGTLPLYDLQCEVFEFNGEKFNTGNATIDAIADSLTLDTNEFPGLVPEIQDVEFDNIDIQDEADEFIVHDDIDPFSGGNF